MKTVVPHKQWIGTGWNPKGVVHTKNSGTSGKVPPKQHGVIIVKRIVGRVDEVHLYVFALLMLVVDTFRTEVNLE